VQGEIDIYTAPRLRELLIDLVSTGSYQLVVNLDKVGFLDSTGLGVLVGGLKGVRAHDGSLDLVCTQQRILKILRIAGLTEVFGIYATVDQAIAATKGRRQEPLPLLRAWSAITTKGDRAGMSRPGRARGTSDIRPEGSDLIFDHRITPNRSGWQASRLCGSRRADHLAMGVIAGGRKWSRWLACRDRLPCGSVVAGECRPGPVGLRGAVYRSVPRPPRGVDGVELTGTGSRGECWD
jgi:anti-sigma B factor antagonist